QGVRGNSATAAGFVLIPESLSWSLISVFIAVLLRHLSFQRIVRLGTYIALPGIALLLFFTPQTGLPFMLFTMVVIGCGLGLSANVYTLSVQSAAPRNLIGVASAFTQFVRTIGGTVGVAIMGAILNAQMAQRFAPILTHFVSSAAHLPKNAAPANILLTPALRASLPTDFLDQLTNALSQSLFWVYALMTVLALCALITMFWFPREQANAHPTDIATTQTSLPTEQPAAQQITDEVR
ncbi:MAG TPA: hypothetical protein VGU68_17700, partial [Ktedonobacteraceae bacterium]|nr:hypothetical protein [Ktedonobacteraceae bacterium]